jgi:N-acetylglucosaminylphosphatidylinositol deacetylase
MFWAIGFLVWTVVYYLRTIRNPTERAHVTLHHGTRVMVVTAHPDDECMFFSPTVVGLQRRGYNVHVLCLSEGNYDGLGSIRREELVASAGVLGIPIERVAVLDNEATRDHPTRVWPAALVAQLVEKYVDEWGIGAIVTFDKYGVSGHVNHMAVHHGVVHYSATSNVRVYTLDSIPLVRKYLSFADTLFSRPLLTLDSDDMLFVSTPSEYKTAVKAMLRHSSQMVWFRWLYIIFSRYMVINVLHRIK